MAGEAAVTELPLEADVMELPLVTEFREGKQVIRDTGGQIEGVVDTSFADLDWDASVLEQMR